MRNIKIKLKTDIVYGHLDKVIMINYISFSFRKLNIRVVVQDDDEVPWHQLKIEPILILSLNDKLKESATLCESIVKITCLNSNSCNHSMATNKPEA